MVPNCNWQWWSVWRLPDWEGPDLLWRRWILFVFLSLSLSWLQGPSSWFQSPLSWRWGPPSWLWVPSSKWALPAGSETLALALRPTHLFLRRFQLPETLPFRLSRLHIICFRNPLSCLGGPPYFLGNSYHWQKTVITLILVFQRDNNKHLGWTGAYWSRVTSFFFALIFCPVIHPFQPAGFSTFPIRFLIISFGFRNQDY